MFTEANIKKVSDHNYQVSYGDDRSVFAQFFSDAVLDQDQTKTQGRPIYKTVNMLRITFPGDNTKEIVRIVRMEPSGNTPSDPDRFPRQWAAFQNQEHQVVDGTPIEQWPPITKAQAMELKALKIYTVEQLASMPDGNLKWMGARQLQANARAWLEEAESGKKTIDLQNQIEALTRQIQAMQNQNAGFSASEKKEAVLESAVAAPIPEAEIKPIVTKMRGRPKKAKNGADIPSIDAAGGE
jgi:hypothetical protein